VVVGRILRHIGKIVVAKTQQEFDAVQTLCGVFAFSKRLAGQNATKMAFNFLYFYSIYLNIKISASFSI